jgi:recombination protein RecA
VAVPAALLQQFSSALHAPDGARAPSILPLELGEVGDALPGGGISRGEVVELSVAGGAATATSLALAACRAAQAQGRERGGESAWCAFVDPSGTLHAPGVARAGVDLERLLVVRPPLEALSRVAVRLVESQAFAVTVIDTAGVPGASLVVPLGSWPRVVRRLALALAGSEAVVLLVTDAGAPRPLPLPVAQRIELSRPTADRLTVRVAKDRRGRLSSPRTVAWVRPGVVASANGPSVRRAAG